MAMINNSTACFTSNTCEWETPKELFDALDLIYHFDMDVCATPENAKCRQYFTKQDDALSKNWGGVCWMNPPYGREIGKWMKKAYESVRSGDASLVCCLVPSRTDTAWWHEYAVHGDITFIRGRLKFGGQKNPAPFPSAIVVFKRRNV